MNLRTAAGNELAGGGIAAQNWTLNLWRFSMIRSGSCSTGALLFVVTPGTLGCGSGRRLQSVAIMPAVADAKNFPKGQVPLTATGKFNKAPSPQTLTNADISWCVGSSNGMCNGNIAGGALVDQNGMAQCSPNFVGTATILAGKANPPMQPDGGSELTVFGSAQLNCP